MALQLLLSLIIRSVVPSYILSFKYLFLSQLHIMVENNKVFFFNFLHVLRKDVFNSYYYLFVDLIQSSSRRIIDIIDP